MTIAGIMIGSTFQMLMNIYKSYSYMYDMNSLDLELSNASMKIVKYLDNRVAGSVIDSNDTNITILSGNYNLDNNRTIQWIGKAFDSYNGTWNSSKKRIISNWSGVIDLNKEHNKTLLYIDSNISLGLGVSGFDTNISQAREIIYLLSDTKVDIFDSSSNSPPAIFFKGGTGNSIDGFGWKYSILKEKNSSKYAFIGYFDENISDNRFLSINQTKGFEQNVKDLQLYEQYNLSWTAYGLKVEEDRNLSLYYNYRPWNGENMEKNGTKITLLRNVTKFNYGSNGSTIRLEICIKDDKNQDIVFCRESLIY